MLRGMVISLLSLMALKGVAGLSARDIKLVVDGGFNTVESVAYTYASQRITVHNVHGMQC